jgi:hypothetical protein
MISSIVKHINTSNNTIFYSADNSLKLAYSTGNSTSFQEMTLALASTGRKIGELRTENRMGRGGKKGNGMRGREREARARGRRKRARIGGQGRVGG